MAYVREGAIEVPQKMAVEEQEDQDSCLVIMVYGISLYLVHHLVY